MNRIYKIGMIFWLVLFALLATTAPLLAAESPPAAPSIHLLAQDEPEGEEESSLPPEINAIIASLTIYILTMFTMALGTEIAVDVVKHAFGLRSKPTARRTIDEFESLLPGNLADFGAAIEEQEKLQKRISDLKRTLRPLAEADDLIGELREGEFKAAVTRILDNANVLEEGQTLDALVKETLRDALERVAAGLNLPNDMVSALLFRLNDEIAQIDLQNLQDELKRLLPQLSAEMITAWIRRQVNEIGTDQRRRIEQQYEFILKPQLRDFGFTEAAEERVDKWFDGFLDDLENYSGRQVDIYLHSLNELLVGVERQRFLIQSPSRHFWRRICDADNPLGRTFTRVEDWFNRLLGRTKKTIDDISEEPVIKEATSAARVILELDRKYKSEDSTRVRWLRTLAVVVAIVLAYTMQIDSADLLMGLLPDSTTGFLTTRLITAGTTFLGFTFTRDLTAGILLTGLAASAGSTFWHNRLTQLQAVRQTAETAASVLSQVGASKASEEKKNAS